MSGARIRRKADLLTRERANDVRRAERDRTVSWWFHDEDRRFRLEAELPGADGAAVAKALDRLAQRIPAMPGEDRGSYIDARRADALVALASAGIAADPELDRGTVVVHIPFDALISEEGRGAVEGGPRRLDPRGEALALPQPTPGGRGGIRRGDPRRGADVA